MTALDVFTFDATDVRALTIDGEPWFVGADLARLLGYRDTANAARILDEDMRGTQIVSTPGGDQEMTVVSEPGLYRLIMRSQRPEARRIERWVVTDVLPAIRRTGTYGTVDVNAITRSDLARMILEAEDARALAEARVAELEPKAAFTEALLTTSGDYSVREAAQILSRDHGVETGQRRLFATLRTLGWVDRNGVPYQRHVDVGRVTVRVQTYDHPYTGEPTLAKPQVRITPRGLTDLHRHLTPSRALVSSDTGAANPAFLLVPPAVAAGLVLPYSFGTSVGVLVAAIGVVTGLGVRAARGRRDRVAEQVEARAAAVAHRRILGGTR